MEVVRALRFAIEDGPTSPQNCMSALMSSIVEFCSGAGAAAAGAATGTCEADARFAGAAGVLEALASVPVYALAFLVLSSAPGGSFHAVCLVF